MAQPYQLEQAEAEIARQEGLRHQELESQLAQAKPAEAGEAVAVPARTDGDAMRVQLEDRALQPEIAAEQRLDAAAQPSDKAVPGQMTDTPLHQQGDKPDCLLQSARMVEHRQLGTDPGLEAYKDRATEKGVYDPGDGRPRTGGTEVSGMKDIINERPGLSAELQAGQRPEDIKAALDKGDSVIAGVDSSAFYEGRYEDNVAGHAIVVTSAEQSPSGQWEFRVNDPAADGPNVEVPGDRFLKAWDRVGRPMLVVRKTEVA